MLYQAQIASFWAAVLCYIVVFVPMVWALMGGSEQKVKQVYPFVYLGLILHTLGLGLRWLQIGHFPYVTFYEATIGDALMGVILYAIIVYFQPRFRFIGVVLLPLAFLLMGVGIMSGREIESAPSSYATYWLYVHVGFAKLSYGSALVAAATAGLYLLKERKPNQGEGWLRKFPSTTILEESYYRFAGFAFVMLGVMILSGAIWAKKSWGRYWGWDPVETWAMISWLVYGLYLHLRFTFNWRNHKGAWLTIGAFVVVVFAYFVSPYLYQSIHEHFGN